MTSNFMLWHEVIPSCPQADEFIERYSGCSLMGGCMEIAVYSDHSWRLNLLGASLWPLSHHLGFLPQSLFELAKMCISSNVPFNFGISIENDRVTEEFYMMFRSDATRQDIMQIIHLKKAIQKNSSLAMIGVSATGTQKVYYVESPQPHDFHLSQELLADCAVTQLRQETEDGEVLKRYLDIRLFPENLLDVITSLLAIDSLRNRILLLKSLQHGVIARSKESDWGFYFPILNPTR